MNNELVHAAITKVNNNAGITARWKTRGPLDGYLIFRVEGREFTYVVQTKKELRQYQINDLLQLHKQYGNLMVVAGRIFPKIKEALRTEGIGYLETNGNLFLKNKCVYILIDTHKQGNTIKTGTTRAFTKTGLKVIFHFLLDKNLVNRTHREIAATAGIALGNIPMVINVLRETGFLLPLNNKTYVWENRRGLLEKWIEGYALDLRPKLHKGNYTLKGNWDKIKLNRKVTVWGGEPAADILTGYLRPEKLTLYTKEGNPDLMKSYRLIPQEHGKTEVLEMFWENRNEEQTAPPLLVYADLRIIGGKRNNETAQKIFNEHIETSL